MAIVETAPPILGKYRPIATLGRGGMARVVLTVASGPARVRKLLVVKEILPELAQDMEFVAMFLDEARIAARLSHPNVIHTYDVGLDDGRPFMVMEYLSGQSLGSLVARVKRANMPLPVHLRILTRVLAGLHYAHELRDYDGSPLSVVHRDVSPQNVFVCYDGQVKVVDFGVAKVAGSAVRTTAGTFKGKIGYIAPEQLSGEAVDRRADVFSVGVLLWEALARRRLTAEETEMTVVHKRLHGTQPRIKDLHPEIPDELAAICDKAMALRPDDRYSSADEMQKAIESFLEIAGLREDERGVSKLVTQAFELERARIHEIIEQQIGRASEGSLRMTLPNLDAVPPDRSQPPPAGSGSLEPSVTLTPPGRRVSTRRRIVAVAAGAAAVIAVVIALLGRGDAPSSAKGAAASASAVARPAQAPRSVEAEPRTSITLTVQVTPPTASVMLDGEPIKANPFHWTVPKDTKVHKLVASAPGFVPEERLLTYDQDAIIDLVMKRGTFHGSPGVQAAAPGADLKPPSRPKPTIDEEDPYR